ncbi:MAG: hypothetical protein LBM23_10510 [Propionibacteriaceae bacterium]|jgi:ABC-2 type transport system permease protein|nr:hypothetical protein [Propionibacteriaceae bacterium]
MVRLFKAELKRMWHRDAIRWLSLALVAALVVLTVVLMWSARPLSGDRLIQAEQNYEMAAEDWELNGPSYLEQCREAEALMQKTNPEYTNNCDLMEGPTREQFLQSSPSVDVMMASPTQGGTLTMMGPLISGTIIILIAAMAIGGEFGSGFLTTWLTFEPRRTLVYVSKILAVGAVGAVIAFVTSLFMTLAPILAVTANGQGLATSSTNFWGSAWLPAFLLSIVLGFITGVASAGLAFVLRNTALMIGILVGYIVLIEAILSQAITAIANLLLTKNAMAILSGWTQYPVEQCGTNDAGEWACQTVYNTMGRGQGLLYTLIVTALCVVAGWALFQRREIK